MRKKLSRLFGPHSEVYAEILRKVDRQKELEKRRNEIRPLELWEVYAQASEDYLRVKNGEYSMDLIVDLLNKLFRSEDQKEMHKAFMASCLRIIFGPDYEKHKHMLKKKYGFARLVQQCIVTCPRRHGKTFATAQYAAICLLCVFVHDMMVKDSDVKRGLRVSIFSPSKRQSHAVVAQIEDILEKLNYTDRVVNKSKDRIQVLNFEGKLSTVTAYPAISRTVRGCDGDILICDEIAFIPEQFIKDVVLPVFSIDHTSLIGISTILDDENLMSKFIEMKDNNGEDLFNTLRVFSSCAMCREKDMAASCTHKTNVAPWQSLRKHVTLKNIYQEDEKTFLQEIGGIAFNINESCFKQKFVKDFMKKQPLTPRNEDNINYVFIAVDPSGCGTSSDVSIVSMVRYYGSMIIVGAENKNMETTKEARAMLIAHVEKLNQNSRLRNALKVFVLENNLAAACEIMSDAVQDHCYNYIIMNKMKGHERMNKRVTESVGVRTTHQVKQVGVELIGSMLKNNSLHISDEELFTSWTMDRTQFKNLIGKQLQDFCKVTIEKELEKDKIVYTGKVKGSKKDDLVMALLIGIFWSQTFFSDPAYEPYIIVDSH